MMTPVSLDAVLSNKEARVARQQEWLARYALPLISISVNMPGAYKDTPSSNTIFTALFHALTLHVKAKETFTCNAPTGPEALLAIDAEALFLKKLTCKLEKEHPLGRFIDMDVIDANGEIVSRTALGEAKRKCYVCEDDAVLCGRSRKHKVEELTEHIETQVRRYLNDANL